MAPPLRKGGRFVKKKDLERQEKCKAAIKLVNQRNALAKETEPAREGDVGRRIVDLGLLASEMWCPGCGTALSFQYLEEEKQAGLASCFKIRCHTCLLVKNVMSSKTVPDTEGNGRPLYAVNCKAALGCIDSGCGHEQLNHLLSTMNIPIVCHTTMKRAEKRVLRSVEAVAKKSCLDAIQEEKTLTLQAMESSSEESGSMDCDNNQDDVDVVVKYDFAWNKRGNGRAYDSKTGFGSVFGHYSKKVMAFDVRSTDCAMCRRGHESSDHACVKNWDGSSKSMEPDVAVGLLAHNEDFEKCGVKVGVLIGDDDSSTMAAVQRETVHSFQKWLDKNHNTKSFSSQLYRASSKHRILTSDVIRYLKRCYSYAVSQNKGNVEGTRRAILNILNHSFGSHSECGQWCKAKGNPSHVYKGLPKGQPFSCPSWKADLQKILEVQASKAAQIAPGGSTQNNESFNQMVATRAPKSRFYGSSPAGHGRVAAAVCQKNLGATHVVSVNRHAHLSPGGVTQKYREKIQKKRETKAAYQGKIEIKRRRLFMKARKSCNNQALINQEGLTYEKGMGNTMSRAAAAAIPENESFVPMPMDLNEEQRAFVYVDIETTGLEATAQIVQLSAKCGENCFNVYMLPTKSINPRASEATGLRVVRGELYYHENKVQTTPPRIAADSFVTFLKSAGPQVILLGHNIVRFDSPRICKWLSRFSLVRDMCDVVYGMCDTLKVIGERGKKKEEQLAREYLKGEQWDEVLSKAHNAMTDCVVLEGLINHFEISASKPIEHCQTMHEFFENKIRLKRKKLNLPPLLAMKERGLSTAMCAKMAAHGITIEELQAEFKQHGRTGLEVCLGVQVNGKARVTTHRKIIDKVELYIASLQT